MPIAVNRRQPTLSPTCAMTLRIHLSIMQPAGYVHSQGFLDQARYARHQLRRLGADVTIGKNRLREDSVNIVFGAHLGFSSSLLERYTCIFFNLEQLGTGGAQVSPDYLSLLRTAHVIDYDERNLPAYGRDPNQVPIVSFEWAPYLATPAALPIDQRPIDLLFFGSINERRKALFARIEACGWKISFFDHPLYGDERDQFIRQSKAVFNCHFYETSRFEQARAFHTLSLGTPLISERTAQTQPPAAFEDAVTWVTEDTLESFFCHEFMTPQWQAQAQAQLRAFAATDSHAQWELAYGYCEALARHTETTRSNAVWRPTVMNLGSGKDYKLGWLNVDVLERAQPDLVLDLGQPVSFPLRARASGGGQICLATNSLDSVYAKDILEKVLDLNCLMTNLLALLREDGELEVEVRCDKSPSDRIDLTQIRTMDKNSWLRYTKWFWSLGWFEHRFEICHFQWLDCNRSPCEEKQSSLMQVKLKKISTTPHERSVARTMQADFAGIPLDAPETLSAVRGINQCQSEIMSETRPITSVHDMTGTRQPSPPDQAWLKTLPPGKNVLSIGEHAHRLRPDFLSAHPDARWDFYRSDMDDASYPQQHFDLVVIDSYIATAPNFIQTLQEISDVLTPHAALSIALKNASAQNVIDKLFECDTSREEEEDGSDLNGRESHAHIYKRLLDAGWAPAAVGHRLIPNNQKSAAQTTPARAREAISAMDSIYVVAHRDMSDLAYSSGKALFTVVVPSNQEQQLLSNVRASAGLKEVQARVISIKNARSPAEAVSESLGHLDTEWVLLAHQDVYFPKGFGERLNAVLQTVPAAEKKKVLIGFAGMAADLTTKKSRPAGHVIDRVNRFNAPATDTAISIDEFAVVFHKDSIHKIDPALGWHLWATDLCLTSLKNHQIFPSIIRMPVFHNSRTGWKLPGAFYASAATLLQKHAEFAPIQTLCGTLDEAFLASGAKA
jgi:hypothetical protein